MPNRDDTTTSSSRIRRTALALTLAGAAALGTVGASCSSDSDSGSATSTTAVTKDTTGAKQGVSVKTPAGEVSLSLDGKLPPDWPTNFPTPSGARTAGSGSLVKDDSGVQVGVFTTKQSGSDAYDFYTGQASLKPTDQKSTEIGSAFLGSMKISGEDSGSVTIAELGGTTYIVAVLSPSGGTTTSSTTTTMAGSTSTTAGA
jgi:hypothetical protein